MSAKKYVYNPKTLNYEEFKISWKKRLGNSLLYFGGACVMGFILLILVETFLGSPKEKMQAKEIDYLHLQYDILNDRVENINQLLAEIQDRDDNIYRIIFEADPIPSSIRKAGFGGADRYSSLDGFVNSELVTETARKIDVLTSQLYVQSKSFDEIYNLAKDKSKMLSSIPAIMPVRGTEIYRISSYFGHRMDPFYKVDKFHGGLDYSAPVGTPVYVTGDGVVEKVVKSQKGYGNFIIVDHGYGYKTRYAHLNTMKVKVKEKVSRGQEIATIGNTGKSTAPHLHYEVIKNNRAVDPIHFFFNDLTPEEYENILDLSQYPSQSMD